MSEPLLPATSEETYLPISGYAMSGLIISGVFAAVVLLSTSVGLIKGAPIFFPLWLLLAPIVGFVLCLIGRNQIVGSEGTRAGIRLANWGLALAVSSGLGYAAYYITVGMAVAKQANDFVIGAAEPDSGFLAHIRRAGTMPGSSDIAFLMTRPVSGRISVRPGEIEPIRTTYDQPANDAGAGEVTKFCTNIFVRMLERAGADAEIEPLGVRDWAHEKSSYKVARNYRLRTPEGTIEVLFQAESSEPEKEGERRRWFINLMRSPILKKDLSPLGKVVEQLKDQSRALIEREGRGRKSADKAFADFGAIEKTNWQTLVPDQPENLKGGKSGKRDYYREQLRAFFNEPGTQSITINYDPNSWPLWGVDGQGRFWIEHPIRLLLSAQGDGRDFPQLQTEGVLRIRTKEPLDPNKVSPPAPNVGWEIYEVKIQRARAPRMGP